MDSQARKANAVPIASVTTETRVTYRLPASARRLVSPESRSPTWLKPCNRIEYEFLTNTGRIDCRGRSVAPVPVRIVTIDNNILNRSETGVLLCGAPIDVQQDKAIV